MGSYSFVHSEVLRFVEKRHLQDYCMCLSAYISLHMHKIKIFSSPPALHRGHHIMFVPVIQVVLFTSRPLVFSMHNTKLCTSLCLAACCNLPSIAFLLFNIELGNHISYLLLLFPWRACSVPAIICLVTCTVCIHRFCCFCELIARH